MKVEYSGGDMSAAKEIVDVVARLRIRRKVDPGAEAAFEKVAAAYRARSPKPALPEEVRRSKVQAEDAVRERRFEAALELYEAASAAAPWWPDAHFNAALIHAELGSHEDAIRAMKRYLLLAPEAPDAREAQDRIYSWEGKLR
jgi:tetratricopeptide (TPR) repeat protein